MPNKGINLVVNLQGKQEAIKQLDEIMKYSNKELKINISKDSINSLQTFKNLLNEINNVGKVTIDDKQNSNFINKTIEDLQREKKAIEEIEKTKQKMIKSNATISSIDVEKESKSYEALTKRVNEIKASMNSISNIKMSTNQLGILTSAVISYKNNVGQAVRETMKLVDVKDNAGNVIGQQFKSVGNINVTDNINKQQKAIQSLTDSYEKQMNRLNSLKDSGNFYDSYLSKKLSTLTNGLNLKDLEASRTMVSNLSKELDKLQSKSNKLNAINSFLSKTRNDFLILKDNDLFGSLNTSNIEKYEKAVNDLVTKQDLLRRGAGKNVTEKSINADIDNITNAIKRLKKELIQNITTDKLITQAKSVFEKLDISQFNTKAIDNLEKRLNSFSTKTAKEKILEFIGLINSLSKNSYNITRIEDELKKLENQKTKLTSDVGTNVMGSSDLKPQLDSLNEKIKQLIKSRDILKSGGFLDSSRIKSEISNVKNEMEALKTSAKNIYNGQKDSTNTLDNGIINRITLVKKQFEELNKSNLSNSLVAKLQKELDSLNVNTSIEAINKFQQSVKNVNNNSNLYTRLNNKVNSLNSSYERLKETMGDSLGNPRYAKQVQALETEIGKMKNAMIGLSNGSTNIKSNQVTEMCSNATTALRNLNTVTGNTVPTMQRLQQTLSKFGIYTSLAITMRKFYNEIKEGIQYVKYLDESFTDIKMTMDITKQDFDDMSSKIDEMGNKIGISLENIHDIARVYSNNMTSVSEILAKTKPTAEYSNISGYDGLSATKNLQDIANQFKMLEKDGANAGEVFSHIGDVMTNVSKNMVYDFATGLQELSSAISQSGSVAEMSGVSLESYVATIGALIEQTGKSGSELANAYKMISARVMQQKSVAEDLGVNEEDLSKASKALDRLGIDLESSRGKLKSLDQVLEEVAGKWDGLTDVERQYTSEMLAGNRQRAIFISLMESMNEQKKLYNEAVNSDGALEKANEVKAESIEGRINTLQNKVKGFWSSFISSDFVKGIISGVTTLVEKLEYLPSVLGTILAIVIQIKGAKLWESFLNSSIVNTLGYMRMEFQKLRQTQGLVKASTGALSSGFKALGLSINPLSTILASATIAFTIYKQRQEEYKKELKEIADLPVNMESHIQSANDGLKQIANLQNLVSKQKNLEVDLSNPTLKVSELTKKKEELLEVQKQIADILPTTATKYDEEGNAIATNIENTEELIKKKKEEQKLKFEQQMLEDKATALDAKNKYKDAQEEIEKLKNRYARELTRQGIKDFSPNSINDSNENPTDFDAWKTQQGLFTLMINSEEELRERFEKEREDLLTEINKQVDILNNSALATEMYNNYVSQYKKMYEGDTNKDLIQNIDLLQKKDYYTSYSLGTTVKSYELEKSLSKAIDEVTSGLKKQTNSLEDNTKKQLENIRAKYTNADKEEISKNYKDSLDTQKKALEIQKQLTEEGKITPTILQSLLELYPEIGSKAFDFGQAQEFINQKVKEQTDIQKGYYLELIQNDEDYFNTKIKNTQSYNQYISSSLNVLKELNINYYNNNINGMQQELQSAKSLAEARIIINQRTVQAVSAMWKEFYSSMAQASGVFDSNGNPLAMPIYDGHGEVRKGMEKYAEQEKMLQALADKAKQAENKFALNLDIDMPLPSFNDIGTLSSSKSTSEKEKDYSVEDLESMTKKFEYLKNLIDDCSDYLGRLDEKMKYAYGSDKQDLMNKRLNTLKKELDLYKQLDQEQTKEALSQKSYLKSKGLIFDENDDIVNRNQLLESLRLQCNAMNDTTEASANAKKKQQEHIKDLEKAIDDYTSLTQNDLAETRKKWLELNNTIKDTYKDMADEISTSEKNIAEAYEHELQKRFNVTKEYIDKIKKKNEEIWEEEDWQDEKAKAEQELADIKAQIENAIRSGDLSLIEELKKQYEQQQKDLNEKIRDKERDNIRDRLDNEEEELDKKLENMLKPENMNKIIGEALKTGYLKIGDEIISVQNAMTDMVNETTKGFETAKLSLDEYLRSLSNALKMHTQLGEINKNLGLVGVATYLGNTSIPIPETNKSVSLNITSPLINIENADSKSVDKIEDIVDNAIGDLVEKLNKEFRV